MNITEMRRFVVQDHDLDELMAADAAYTGLAQTYSNRQLEMPEWLGEQLTEVDIAVKALVKATRMASIKKKKAQLLGLMTVGEKRERLEAEIAAEEGML
uniref:Uncharacterized protein n=1 Tax=viral metagenome TaxID=1070528 RepID=A0A6M3M123_9ZZZZ